MTRQEIIKLWTTALRSGKYEQGYGWLNKWGKFCCLGVLCQELIDNNLIKLEITKHGHYGHFLYNNEASFLPIAVREFTKIESLIGKYGDSNNDTLVKRNDSGLSFNQIADLIEENAPTLFTKE